MPGVSTNAALVSVSRHRFRNNKHDQIASIISKAAHAKADVIKINAIGADPEYIYSVADLPHFRTRHEQRT